MFGQWTQGERREKSQCRDDGDDGKNNGKPYYECSTCGLRFQIKGFDEKPVEIKE